MVRELRTIKKKTVPKVSVCVSVILLAAIFSFSSSVPTSTLTPEQIATEPAIAILNPQSYPSVGENWIAWFNTTGQANLTVTSVNNTSFGVDIQFLELRCGDGVVNATPKYNGDSVFYADWNCSETGYFGVKVLKAGKHTLEFRFWDDVAYAHNDAAGWYDTNWTYRKKITIDHTKVNGTQTNFPVLINLSFDSELAAKAQDDGDDILFTSSDGTNKLAHEIELYDSATGKLIAWVNVTILSNTTDTVLYLYYNNSAASNQQNPAGVWNTNYRGVYHMKDKTTSTIDDSTSNNKDGTKGATNEPIEADGKIGKGQSFDGSNDYITASLGAVNAPFTVEAWGYFNSEHQGNNDWDYILMLGQGPNDMVSISRGSANGGIPDKYYSYTYRGIRSGPVLTGQQWLYVAVVWDNSSPYHNMYLNGEPQTEQDVTSAVNTNGELVWGNVFR
jgi:hypothetical protein